MTASLRPWEIGPFSRKSHHYIDDADGDQVAGFLQLDDADLAIRAVNSFDALVEALEALVNETDSWNSAIQAIIGRQPNTGINLERARDALALAKGADRG